jgi:hypothetical protein
MRYNPQMTSHSLSLCFFNLSGTKLFKIAASYDLSYDQFFLRKISCKEIVKLVDLEKEKDMERF